MGKYALNVPYDDSKNNEIFYFTAMVAVETNTYLPQYYFRLHDYPF